MKKMGILLAALWLAAVGLKAATPTFTITVTFTKTVTTTNTATPSITPTWSITKTRTITPSVTKTITVTFSSTRTVTPSSTRTPSFTITPTRTVTPTNTPMNTPVSSVLQALGTSMVKVDPSTSEIQGMTVFGVVSISGSAGTGATASLQQTQVAQLGGIQTSTANLDSITQATIAPQINNMAAGIATLSTTAATLATASLQQTQVAQLNAQQTQVATLATASLQQTQVATLSSQYGFLSGTAGGTAPRPCGGYTYTNVTYNVLINLTTTAGYNGAIEALLSPGIGAAASFYYDYLTSSAYEAPSSLFAVSTTPMALNRGPGWCLVLSPTGGAIPLTFSAKLKLGCY